MEVIWSKLLFNPGIVDGQGIFQWCECRRIGIAKHDQLFYGTVWNGTGTENEKCFCIGIGLPNYEWQVNFPLRGYYEALITYLLAVASPTHPIPASIYHQGMGWIIYLCQWKTFMAINFLSVLGPVVHCFYALFIHRI